MTDLGHDLRFGAFLTPSANGHREVVRLAILADEMGLDLLGIQDHPYQPAYLDTWTLLSHLAGKTQRVGLVPDVANLPLRPPAVLARSAASLDILSGGRVELGIGAGAFWDAIAAMGGVRRSPGESIEALEEAIAVIRALWTPGRTPRLEGRHYSLKGAKPGPFPAHRIEIWVGAYKPRMLDLTGRLGDGWLPSSMYASPAELARMSAVVDRAAIEAGRSPADVRRVYNIGGRFSDPGGREFLVGPPKQWADQLTELALEQGVSGFVLAPGSDDVERELRTFAEEVVPLVRSEVYGARDLPASGSEQEPARPREQIHAAADDPLGEVSRPRAPRPEAATRIPGGNGSRLVLVHNSLRNEMRQLRDAVAEVAAGTSEAGAVRSMIDRLTLRQNFWTLGSFCASYCRILTTHHTIEDEAMFPALAAQQESLAPVVERLQHEHEVIAEVLVDLDAALVALMEDDTKLADVQDQVALLDLLLNSHLDYEEEELVEPLDRLNIAL
ncbi:MAG: LLM class flavin-dependent oxidoreductase [Propionibacteriales bacterium]|nr:LLM class flavin-dependent oxidoreductase [Propionibacteriales bacterium]